MSTSYQDWLAQQLLDPEFKKEYERIAPPYRALDNLPWHKINFWYRKWWELGSNWSWPDWWMRLGAKFGWADFEDDKS